MVYELSLRPLIPLMDLLYFEYLRRRLEVGTVKKVVVVPWSGWSRSDENLQKEHDLLQNLKIVFGEEFGRVKVLSGADFQPYAKSLLREEFFDSLESLGRSEFLRSSSRIMGYPFRSYHDINSGHPESVQSRSLVEHSLRGWLVLKYLQDNELQSGDIRCIGALMWERELTKLLLLKNLEASTGVRPALLLGKSITFWQSGRKPIPTFESEAIEVFGDFDEQVTKLTRKSIAELARTRELLEAILESRAFELTLRESAPHVAPRPALRRSVEQTADLLSQLQSRLGG
ncbi:hypothetical protein LG324_09525 [Phycicoccus jejuensis]|uniref:hypothetical protein n=1 Tax=Phycicoccus jejuensis TaxID=367299 RepID=UPI00384ABEEC